VVAFPKQAGRPVRKHCPRVYGTKAARLFQAADRLFYGAHEIRPEEDGSFSHSTFDGGLANRISQNAGLSFEWVALENKK
jgi:hypothetical protein